MIPNLQDYNYKKAKDLISIQKIDEENFAICEKKFDMAQAVLGELIELPAEVKGVTLSEVDEEIDKITKEKAERLAELKAFKADLTSAV